MACCGEKRQQQHRTYGGTVSGGRRPGAAALPPRVFVEYTGATAIAVVGPVSGLRYVFDGPGARAEVDPRDRRSLLGVPGLREVA
jgi:hypothetical protein